MPYVEIQDFKAGVNRTRPRYAGPPGSLWAGINGHISRGGDFEKRKAFVPFATLPDSTFGLMGVGGTLYTFGSQAAPAMPPGITYQQLAAGSAMTEFLSADAFDGKPYVVARYADTVVRHYYNGSEVTDWNTVAIQAANRGTVVRTHGKKMYAGGGSLLFFSDRDDAVEWNGTLGSGYENLANHQSGSDAIRGLAKYQKYLASFARRAIAIWDVQTDPDNNTEVQTIEGTGARAGRAVKGYGDLDVFYLADTGVRSLRSRDITNSASVNDVGTPIDTLVQEVMAALPSSVVDRAVAEIEPVDGRFMLAIGEYVFVFTYFPASKISAWTWYEPGFTISDFAVVDKVLYARAGNTVYRYGGEDGETYDSCRVTLALPFMAAAKSGQFKQFVGMDVAATGEWAAQWLVNPRDEREVVQIGALDGFTIQDYDTGGIGHFTHIAPVLTHEAPGAASVSSILLHYLGAEIAP